MKPVDKLLLSICVPTYRRPKSLRRCLYVISKEIAGFKDVVEVRVRDNDPKSKCGPFVSQLARRNGIKLEYKRNSRNIGPELNIYKLTEEARGTYVFFLTDDDELEPGFISKLIGLLRVTRGINLVVSQIKVYMAGKYVRTAKLFGSDKIVASGQALEQAKIFYNADTLSGICVRRKTINLNHSKQYAESLYMQMYMVGKAALAGQAYCIATPSIRHTIGNQQFWNYSDDYMISDMLKMSAELGSKNREFKFFADREILSNLPYFIYLNFFSPKKQIKLLRAVLDKGSLRGRPWPLFLLWGCYRIVKSKLKEVLRGMNIKLD